MPAKYGLDGCYVVNENGCFIWQMAVVKRYPYVRRDGKYQLAHRYAYTLAHGPIPEGMTVDHLCFEPLCVNAEHLRLLTHLENTRNQRRFLANVCRRGHPLTEDNFRWGMARGKRYRKCLTCERASDRARVVARRLATST